MVSITSEYGLYLYTGKVDMRKGIDSLCGIISEELGHNPRKSKSVYVFSGRNPRVKKVLIREYNRYELTTIRLDEGRFIRPQTDPERVGGKICWSDFVVLIECSTVHNTFMYSVTKVADTMTSTRASTSASSSAS